MSNTTLMEYYEEGLSHNIDIFSNMVIPADTCIMTKLVKEAILENAGDMIPIFDNYLVLKYRIEEWSRSNEFIFRHVDGILKAKYSPIENTDKYLERTEKAQGQDKTTNDLKTEFDGSTTNSGTDTDTRTLNTTDRHTKGTTTTEAHTGTDTTSGSGSDTTTTSGFNSASYQPDNKVAHSNSESMTHGENITTSETGVDSDINTGTVTDQHLKGTSQVRDDVKTDTGTITTDKDNELKIIEHTHGNIGVSTNTQLISEEVALIKSFNAYDLISEVFINDMMIGVYNL